MTTRVLVLVWIIALIHATCSLAGAATPAFARWMNAGRAHLENRNSAKAIEAFTSALKLDPKSPSALRNLARAQLLANENEQALQSLSEARGLEKDSAATSYLLGLVNTHQSQFEQAVPFFEEAVRLDGFTPALRFQLALAYQMVGLPDKALVQLRETVKLDPLHASAHFRLAALASRTGNRAEYDREQQEFMRLRKLFADSSRTPAALERCIHTQPEPAPLPARPPGAALPVHFVDDSAAVFAEEQSRAATAAAVLDAEAKGGYATFVVDGPGTASLLTMGGDGKFKRAAVAVALSVRGPFHQVITGNFYDEVPKGEKYDPTLHARNDVLLVGNGGICLLQRTGPTAFVDVTERAGLKGVTARRAEWVDYDHDGDIDLLLARENGLQLWQNNGDGRFMDVTEPTGLSGVNGAVDTVAVDLDANVAIDLVAARGAQPSFVFMNQRAGRFARQPEPPGPWPSARRILADDLDNDGNMDALLLGEQEALILFGKRVARHRFDLAPLRESTPALLDFDNDGWLDFCAAGSRNDATAEGAIRLWRNAGGGTWTEVSEAAGLAAIKIPPVRAMVAADFDNDGDTDLLLVTATGSLHFLRNEGGNANRQLKLQLIGTKTNPSGIGARVEVREGEFHAARSVRGLPIEIGLGRVHRLDAVQTIWANGIVDNQLDVAVKRELLTIVEKNVTAGSCPYLYAWDGRGFRFVTDLLGNSPLGLSLRRDAVLPADPEEIVWLGDNRTLRPRRGFYELEVTEELREVLYLDCAKLLVVDHAPGVEVHSTDKLGPPPFPPSELWALRSPRAPASALGSDGLDRTESVRAIDGVFAPPGAVLPPPLRGQCQPLTLTLDFGPLDTGRPLVLALTGWIQYGDASANIALSQNASLPVIPPRLEVERADGGWAPVDVVVGMPAGKTKTILCDLTGQLPRGARRLRLTTTFELRWDRIALLERGASTELEERELLPHDAQLRFRGFSEIQGRAPGHPQTPAYDKASSRPPWRTTPQGWCTRYGDVLDLVQSRDERLLVLNAGETVRLRFNAKSLPPVGPGRERTFFFYAVGWDKDGDPNVVGGDLVEPLPSEAGGNWRLDYNTRWVSKDRFAAPDPEPSLRLPVKKRER